LLSQAKLLARDLPEELKPLSEDEAAAFQVKISKIADLTKLDFGPLAQHDAAMKAFEVAAELRPLRSLGDIAL
jgi:hypothetical protein